jgi:hypothetical protein
LDRKAASWDFTDRITSPSSELGKGICRNEDVSSDGTKTAKAVVMVVELMWNRIKGTGNLTLMKCLYEHDVTLIFIDDKNTH